MHEPQYTKSTEPTSNLYFSAWEQGEVKKTSAPAQLAELEPHHELPAPVESKRKLPRFMEEARARLLYLMLMLSGPRATQEQLEVYGGAVVTYNQIVTNYNTPRGRTAKRRDTKPKAKARKKDARGRRDTRRRR